MVEFQLLGYNILELIIVLIVISITGWIIWYNSESRKRSLHRKHFVQNLLNEFGKEFINHLYNWQISSAWDKACETSGCRDHLSLNYDCHNNWHSGRWYYPGRAPGYPQRFSLKTYMQRFTIDMEDDLQYEYIHPFLKQHLNECKRSKN